jgi:ribonuclease HI
MNNMHQHNEIVMYTDGACDPNPGVGGWAAILVSEHENKTVHQEIKGGEPNTTNNRMEMIAVLKGLQALTNQCSITIYSDSQYVVKSIGSWLDGKPRSGQYGWMVGWHNKGWRKKDGELKNIDLWKLLYAEVQKHKSVNLVWIKGHNGHAMNDRCDHLAVEARKAIINDTIHSNGLQPKKHTNNPNGDGSPDNRVG